MPSPKVFNSLFFIMLLLLGITSATTIVEVSVSILRDQCRELIQRGGACSELGRLIMKKTWFLPCIVSVLSFLLGLLFCRRSGSLWVDLVDGSISNFLLTLIGFCGELRPRPPPPQLTPSRVRPCRLDLRDAQRSPAPP